MPWRLARRLHELAREMHELARRLHEGAGSRLAREWHVGAAVALAGLRDMAGSTVGGRWAPHLHLANPVLAVCQVYRE